MFKLTMLMPYTVALLLFGIGQELIGVRLLNAIFRRLCTHTQENA